jgi:tRNA dimethylallyltransferase
MKPPPSDRLPPAICLAGPTASGKTRIAVELMQSGRFEIISVDSALVYRGLDIGAGKPDAATLALAPHRLIDIRDPAAPYSAAEFRSDALRELRQVLQAGKIPLLVGGTMLYFKALRDGLADLPPADPAIRERIADLADRLGWPAIHARLALVDPVTAARLNPNDPQRLQRALEVYESTGRPLSEFHRRHREEVASDLPCTLHFVGLVPTDRAALHRVIAQRFQHMLDAGLLDEVRALQARGDLSCDLPSLRSVGYRQVWDFLAGHSDHDTMVAKAIAATRQLAKRQLTWLRGWRALQEVPATLTVEDAINVKSCLKSKLGISI